jgi:hypothetical protein
LRPQQRKKERKNDPFFTVMTITGTMYLDMLQQFLIPHLDKDDQEGRIHFQQDGAPIPSLPHHPFPRSVDW